MNELRNILSLICLSIMVAACYSNQSSKLQAKYCGFLTDRIDLNLTIDNPYDFPMGSEVYSAINDTIRKYMPDTIVFEIFLVGISKEAIALHVYAPKSEKYMETIGCAIMNCDYPSFVPDQRFMMYYSYVTDPYASMPLEAMIKRKSK